MTTKSKRFVVVTTEHRGVFFGILGGQDETAKTITLLDAQMCVYWAPETKGVLGLASEGPSKGCRVSPVIPKLVLQGVTAVMDATASAVEAWGEKPWA